MDANYIVMIIVLIVWTGLFIYLFILDRRMRKLEKKDES
jgi:CcmD family protein